jgi:hypothetical protein
MATSEPGGGMAHPTVVPENFEPDPGHDDAADEEAAGTDEASA